MTFRLLVYTPSPLKMTTLNMRESAPLWGRLPSKRQIKRFDIKSANRSGLGGVQILSFQSSPL